MIPLRDDEKLEPGSVVGIDAEFVSLNQVKLITYPKPSLPEQTPVPSSLYTSSHPSQYGLF